ncbi:MAG: PLP-dependent aminotransferase family protein [Anaerolineales bacterium]|nr:PLP-dependent aminotransferase family protein [Anaerolineales bacterium]
MNDLPVTQISIPPGFIDLGMGNPDFDLLPLSIMRRASEAYFERGELNSLQYGAEQGNGYFRATLADFLSVPFKSRVNPDSLFVTQGASSAIDLICTLYTRPGDVIFVEEPTYFLALRIFADHGLRVISIPMDEDGLLIEKLEDALDRHKPKFIYTIPTFQNPSGRTLSPARRIKLIELAQRDKFLILADEVYHLLGYTEKPPAPFALLADDVEEVISINSFSKIMAPGLRLGWIQAHQKILKELAGCGLLDSGGGLNPFTSAIVREAIETGDLAKNIAHLHKEYVTRLNALTAALHQYIPLAEFTPPQGGFFVWARIPGKDTSALRQHAKKFKVDFRPGELFSGQKGTREYMRLGFCFYDPDSIEEGVIRLGNCLS